IRASPSGSGHCAERQGRGDGLSDGDRPCRSGAAVRDAQIVDTGLSADEVAVVGRCNRQVRTATPEQRKSVVALGEEVRSSIAVEFAYEQQAAIRTGRKADRRLEEPVALSCIQNGVAVGVAVAGRQDI